MGWACLKNHPVYKWFITFWCTFVKGTATVTWFAVSAEAADVSVGSGLCFICHQCDVSFCGIAL